MSLNPTLPMLAIVILLLGWQVREVHNLKIEISRLSQRLDGSIRGTETSVDPVLLILPDVQRMISEGRLSDAKKLARETLKTPEQFRRLNQMVKGPPISDSGAN
jgi:hypothetical protein